MLVLLTVFVAASILLPLLRRPLGNAVFPLAALVPAAAFVHTAFQGPAVLEGRPIVETVRWVPQLDLVLSFRMDALSWVLALAVTGIGALVLLYCGRYFAPDEPDLGRFSAVLLAFAGVMYGLVTADDIFLLFIFWEATSVLSYLLIGHFTSRRPSRGAAMQALLVTTFGGLVMLVGLVILHNLTGSSSLAEIVASPPPFDGLAITAVFLVLVGAATKSALLPFHFWLPAAMAAPTPVSAYLHAAAMVKAGIYLIARLAPGFSEMPGWREVLVGLGIVTMLVGGWRALRQYDLKLILAHGTVSQLGFLAAITAFGTQTAAYAALAMLVAHACFKAALFLLVGVIDHRTGTRDIRKLSGLGRSAPVLFALAALAVASMAGIPPLFGFVAKEAVFTAFIEGGEHGMPAGWFAIVGAGLGTVLTVAYSARFLHGAFAVKPGVDRVKYEPVHRDFLLSPLVLVVASIGLGLASPLLDGAFTAHAASSPAVPGTDAYHLALWHGLEPALGVSVAAIAIGLWFFGIRGQVSRAQGLMPPWLEASRGYWASMRFVDIVAARVTALTQRGSLPFYLGTIFVVFVVAAGSALLALDSWPTDIRIEWNWVEVAIVLVMSLAAVAVTRSAKRFQGVVLVGVTGYGMAALFALHGAPDLALTQALIETITLVVFVLVLRRLPARHGRIRQNPNPVARWAIGIAVAVTMGIVAVVALGSRQVPTDGLAFPELAVTGGHGLNIVNVTLVDIRAWDTMGELSVLIAAATGVASLIHIKTRNSAPPEDSRAPGRGWFRRRLAVDPVAEPARLTRPGGPAEHLRLWLLAGRSLAPENRSIVLEVVVRLIFHALFITSLFLLFAGHNAPGGGFAGGIVGGLALAARYLAGGRAELDEAVRVDAGRLLGIGLLVATLTALAPMFLGLAPLSSAYIDEQIPFVGQFVFVTSTVFDIGVYLVVIALVIDILRSLGSQIDQQTEAADARAANDDPAGTVGISAEPRSVPAGGTAGIPAPTPTRARRAAPGTGRAER